MLNAATPWSVKFKSSCQYPRHLVTFSLSGLTNEDELSVPIDGKQLAWTPRKDIGVDRWHYDIHREESLKGGEHELKFELKNKRRRELLSCVVPRYLSLGPTKSESSSASAWQ